MKLNKKEIMEVEGNDWSVELTIETEDFASEQDILIEAATRGVEGKYHSGPESFEIGAVVKVGFKKSPESFVFVNAYTILCNASLFKLAENIRKSFMGVQKIDLLTQPMFQG